MEKAIIISGAAGGLGQAIVRACNTSFPEMKIIATDISPKVIKIFEEAEGILPYEMDVTSEASIISVQESLQKDGIQIWGLINNAGKSDFFPITEKKKDVLENIFAINSFGAVNMVRVFLPHLRRTKGRVVNISSESVRLPTAFHPYASSKITLEALSVSMRNELALFDVKLSIIRPGAINTPFLDDLNSMDERIGESSYRSFLESFARKAPKEIHNICEPKTVAAVVIKALTKKKPRRYYHVNNNPKLRIAQILPHRWRDYFMQRMLKG